MASYTSLRRLTCVARKVPGNLGHADPPPPQYNWSRHLVNPKSCFVGTRPFRYVASTLTAVSIILVLRERHSSASTVHIPNTERHQAGHVRGTGLSVQRREDGPTKITQSVTSSDRISQRWANRWLSGGRYAQWTPTNAARRKSHHMARYCVSYTNLL